MCSLLESLVRTLCPCSRTALCTAGVYAVSLLQITLVERKFESMVLMPLGVYRRF